MYFNLKRAAVTLTFLLISLLALPLLAADETSKDDAFLDGLEWRLIGPYRGGRVTTAVGVADNPLKYYMGAAGGGVWTTENAGSTWENLSDEFFKVGGLHTHQVAKARGHGFEEPDVHDRSCQIDVPHALTSNLRLDHFDATFLADHSAALHALLLAAIEIGRAHV